MKIIDNEIFEQVKTSSENISYVKFASGLIIQWGFQDFVRSINGGANYQAPDINFPISFLTTPSITATSSGNQFNMSVVNPSETKFAPRYRNVNTSTSATTSGCWWIAIGH